MLFVLYYHSSHCLKKVCSFVFNKQKCAKLLGSIFNNISFFSYVFPPSIASCISNLHDLFPAGKSKPVPAPPPRVSSHAVSRESSLKHSHTMQRDSTKGAKRDITQQFHSQTLPLPSSKRMLADSPSPLSSNSSTSSGSHASVKYEGLSAFMCDVLLKTSKFLFFNLKPQATG